VETVETLETLETADTAETADGVVASVHCSGSHTMGKPARSAIRLVAGLGVDGDAHAGVTVRHRSRVARDPTAPNLRQVHLVAAELHDELRERGLAVAPGAMGENVTTRDVDLLALPTGTRLHLGPDAVVEVTGLRNPCRQLDGVREGLMTAVLAPGADGSMVRRAGVMGIVVEGGEVRPGDPVGVVVPAGPHRHLEPV
jgi:MOSC domain-containing protein YiiM